ncbi:NitT/TauT family transport system ATP-binding protein [Granulicatella balaenopterae]|uniref:NitT/TauT family transport system ATP-binding protein n=2 Tax=Granulicatella balaenopterae TaxID=137733 RepID=A0A1H9J2N3_9LACT|nr:NitT/TauT family transport system ATP-binding protein [Granulicatella balaenopterae]
MLEVKDLSYQINGLEIIKNISLTIEKNQVVAIIGPSGCGKSTLLKIIADLAPIEKGTIEKNYHHLSFIFQDNRLLDWLSVWQNIALVKNQEEAAQIEEILSEVGLTNFKDFKPSQLSGGMKKRCDIARAFYYGGDLLLADEPFSGLDYFLKLDMVDLVAKLIHERQTAMLLITHDVDEALLLADKIIILSERPSKVIKTVDLSDLDKGMGCSPEYLQYKQEILELIKSQK